MKLMTPILGITGSDNTGVSGIQADIKTITALGGYALTAVTSVTVQDSHGISSIMDLPLNMVVGQVKAIVNEHRPKAIKVGMVRDVDTICALRHEIVGCPRIVLVPSILNSHGKQLMSQPAINAWKQELIPEATLIQLRCHEAEILLNCRIGSDDSMEDAAKRLIDMGAKSVLLRGGHQVAGRLTALLHHDGESRFFSSQNTEGWQKHGVSGALSTAIASRLAFGDNIPMAIAHAHDYMHSQVVYAVESKVQRLRMADIYNRFMTLIAEHYREAHDVAYYASRLAITSRYLSQITATVVGKSPKQIIADYVIQESITLLATSRLTIGEISNKLGFSSQALFSKFFSTHEGCSPIEYRSHL